MIVIFYNQERSLERNNLFGFVGLENGVEDFLGNKAVENARGEGLLVEDGVNEILGLFESKADRRIAEEFFPDGRAYHAHNRSATGRILHKILRNHRKGVGVMGGGAI